MSVDKEKLKSAALLATKSRWTTDDLNEVMSAESDQLNGGYIIADCQGPDRWRNAVYVAAACPESVLALLAEIDQLNAENERFRRYCEVLEGDKKALTETHVLYTWLRKKVDQPNNEFVALLMKAGQDWVPVHDLDRDLRDMIEREEP
ncbi:hypothetical protein [Pseudomonas sp. SIMBA_067]|uniref:hypothetical protein n=1 Tax=Pseudomonas sp. SIMBA_067 TaxID=3085807 RepID=UPI00397AC9C9